MTRAEGGTVTKGAKYVVGERGQEEYMPVEADAKLLVGLLNAHYDSLAKTTYRIKGPNPKPFPVPWWKRLWNRIVRKSA